MSLIDLPIAKAHLRLEEDYPDEQVTLYLNAAESMAAQFLGRRIFADQDALTEAITAVPGELITARTAYDDAITAANEIEDCVAREFADRHACGNYLRAQTIATETYLGIVIDDMIRAGILLTLGHLFENRQDVVVGTIATEMPLGSRQVLMPYRVGWGV